MLACKQNVQPNGAPRHGRSSEFQTESRPALAGRGQPAFSHRVLNSPGESLDSEARLFFEPRFGHDFSRVRVHADSEADTAARDFEASAYTVGTHMVFASGQYQPQSQRGRQLIAHELAHTIQQSGASASEPLLPGDPSDESEREASRAAAHQGLLPVQARQPLSLQRQPSPTATPRLDLAESVSPFMAAAVGSVAVDGFQTGNAAISGAHKATLAKTAKTIQTLLKQYSGSTIRVIGHTDAIGQESDNDALGQARASSVHDALLEMGIPAELVHVESRGASELLVKTKKSEPRNRRVEVRFEPPSASPFTSAALSTPAPTDLSRSAPRVSGDFCTQFPGLCPDERKPDEKKPPGLPEGALRPDVDTTPFYRMDMPSLKEPFTSHGNQPEEGDRLFENWKQMYWKYRRVWGLSEELAAKAANLELSGTISSSQSRDSPNAIDRSNTEMKDLFPNSTTAGPVMSPFKVEF